MLIEHQQDVFAQVPAIPSVYKVVGFVLFRAEVQVIAVFGGQEHYRCVFFVIVSRTFDYLLVPTGGYIPEINELCVISLNHELTACAWNNMLIERWHFFVNFIDSRGSLPFACSITLETSRVLPSFQFDHANIDLC